MALARQTEAHLIKPAHTATVVQGIVGATIAAGELVTQQSDGYWDPAIATSVVPNVGVAVTGGAVGDTIEIVTLGLIACLTGGTKGAIIYVSDTAGEPSETAGTKSAVVGYLMTLPNEQATQWLMVLPQTVAFA